MAVTWPRSKQLWPVEVKYVVMSIPGWWPGWLKSGSEIWMLSAMLNICGIGFSHQADTCTQDMHSSMMITLA